MKKIGARLFKFDLSKLDSLQVEDAIRFLVSEEIKYNKDVSYRVGYDGSDFAENKFTLLVRHNQQLLLTDVK